MSVISLIGLDGRVEVPNEARGLQIFSRASNNQF